jgi:hypothetical protein
MLTLLFSAALAQSTPSCDAPVSLGDLVDTLSTVEGAIRGGDFPAAGAGAERLAGSLPCVDAVMPTLVAHRVYRGIGAGLYVVGDEAVADRWLRTALELDPTFQFGVEELSSDHPLRGHLEDLRRETADPVPVDGMAFAASPVFLDGREIKRPEARLDRFHLLQLDPASGDLRSEVIDGNDFPDDLLTEGAADESKDDPVASSGLTDKEIRRAEKMQRREARKQAKYQPRFDKDGNIIRRRPAEKTPLMIVGGVIVASAAGIYGASLSTRDRMRSISSVADVNDGVAPDGKWTPCAPDEDVGTNGCLRDPADEVDRLAGVTNRLFVASAAVAAVGVGTFTWGAIVNDQGVVPTVTVRF